ncbi:adenosylcobinamide-GDP ribazoletransferase [uncultured Treponema sp.]|uniref:adenosylcobinamide-GDP ribazoletransferase n=1 Tax=uncultured Treponema sp. TaxID=162155 RepID=UPI0025FC5D5D|nr:adenosylcobinamide-GDP ribazoletransferase [uncultured Treponema sp.]
MFSAVPMPRIEWNQKNMRYMMCAFPFVGALIAFFCAIWLFWGWRLFAVFGKNLSPHILALGLTLIPILISGGIHIDGFMDTCDALASHASREKKLEILKDSHSGAFAVLGCVIYFLSFYIISLELCTRFLNFHMDFRFLLPILSVFLFSRFFSALAVATFPIAKDSGLVHTFSTSTAKLFTALFCEIMIFIISITLIFFCGRNGILPLFSSLAAFLFYYLLTKQNFGGITGDTAGWFVQISELAGLAVLLFA